MTKILIKRLLLYFCCVFAVFTVYCFTASAVAFAGCALLAVLPPLTWAMSLYTGKYVSISLNVPPATSKNRPAEVEVCIRNESVFPVFTCFVDITAENSLTGDVFRKCISAGVSPEGTFRRSVEISSGRCGYINVCAQNVRLCDIFGIFTHNVNISAEGKMPVMPETFDMKVNMSVSYVSKADEDTYSPDKPGNDFSETFQLREYSEGDNVKLIHHKLSDKLGKLIVRDGSLPVVRSVLVLWDKNVRDASAAEMDAMAEVVTSISLALCDMGYLFTLGWTGSGDICLEDISGTDDIFRFVGQMVRCGYCPGLSGAAEYAEKYGTDEFAKIIYIAGDITEDILYAGGDVVAVVCSPVRKESPVRTVYFSADSYIQDMENAEL